MPSAGKSMEKQELLYATGENEILEDNLAIYEIILNVLML